MLQSFPLLAISLIAYAAVTLAMLVGGGAVDHWTTLQIAQLPLASKDFWTVRAGDLFLVASLGLLFVEVVRATQTGKAAITNNIFSVLLFVACLMCFIFAPGFGNSVFFMYMCMTLLDTMAGMIVTTVTARRDFNITDKPVSH